MNFFNLGTIGLPILFKIIAAQVKTAIHVLRIEVYPRHTPCASKNYYFQILPFSPPKKEHKYPPRSPVIGLRGLFFE